MTATVIEGIPSLRFKERIGLGSHHASERVGVKAAAHYRAISMKQYTDALNTDYDVSTYTSETTGGCTFKLHPSYKISPLDAAAKKIVTDFGVDATVYVVDAVKGAMATAVTYSNGAKCLLIMGPESVKIPDNSKTMMDENIYRNMILYGVKADKDDAKYFRASLYHEMVHCYYYLKDYDTYAALLQWQPNYFDVYKSLGLLAAQGPAESMAEFYTKNCHFQLRSETAMNSYMNYLSDQKVCAHLTNGDTIYLEPEVHGDTNSNTADTDWTAHMQVKERAFSLIEEDVSIRI